MGRHVDPTNLHTRHVVERAAARAEREILALPLSAIIPRVVEGLLDVELGLELGANGGLRSVEIGEVRNAGVRLTVQLPVEALAPGRIAPVLTAALLETIEEVRAAEAA